MEVKKMKQNLLIENNFDEKTSVLRIIDLPDESTELQLESTVCDYRIYSHNPQNKIVIYLEVYDL
jgi:hypothetical protein